MKCQMKTIILFYFCMIVFLNLNLRLKSEEPKIKPILQSDPIVLKKIEELGENEIVLLPPAKVLGEFNEVAKKFKLDINGPGIRNYCLKMAWAEDRKRAFFCGGNHGVPHGLNDIWEYDLASNTWLLLWAPDDFTRGKNAGNWQDAILKDGVLQSKRGATVQASHTWDQLTYDPEIQALLWMTTWNIKEDLVKVGLLDQVNKDNKHSIPLWSYYPGTNTWKPLGVGQKLMNPDNASLLCYIPELHATISYGKGSGYKTYLWDNRKDQWSLFCDRPSVGQGPGDEMISCYDTKNKVVIAVSADQRGGGTYHFDPAKKTWIMTTIYEAGKMPNAHDSSSIIGSDPKTGTCILFTNDKKTFGFWSYDVVEKKWAKLIPKGDMPLEVIDPRKGYNGYFDPARNVFILFKDAGREVRAYRFKKAK